MEDQVEPVLLMLRPWTSQIPKKYRKYGASLLFGKERPHSGQRCFKKMVLELRYFDEPDFIADCVRRLSLRWSVPGLHETVLTIIPMIFSKVAAVWRILEGDLVSVAQRNKIIAGSVLEIASYLIMASDKSYRNGFNNNISELMLLTLINVVTIGSMLFVNSIRGKQRPKRKKESPKVDKQRPVKSEKQKARSIPKDSNTYRKNDGLAKRLKQKWASLRDRGLKRSKLRKQKAGTMQVIIFATTVIFIVISTAFQWLYERKISKRKRVWMVVKQLFGQPLGGGGKTAAVAGLIYIMSKLVTAEGGRDSVLGRSTNFLDMLLDSDSMSAIFTVLTSLTKQKTDIFGVWRVMAVVLQQLVGIWI